MVFEGIEELKKIDDALLDFQAALTQLSKALDQDLTDTIKVTCPNKDLVNIAEFLDSDKCITYYDLVEAIFSAREYIKDKMQTLNEKK